MKKRYHISVYERAVVDAATNWYVLRRPFSMRVLIKCTEILLQNYEMLRKLNKLKKGII